MKDIEDLLGFTVALNTLARRYAEHEIDREEYESKFKKIVEAYEAIT